MDYEFVVAHDGLVEVRLPDSLPLMTEALGDSIGSRPPRGASQDGPSTYWIDRALQCLEARLQDGGHEPVAAGNTTYMQLVEGGFVEPRYDFDPPDSENFDTVPAREILALLRDWRERVLREDPRAYRRMPPPTAAIGLPPG